MSRPRTLAVIQPSFLPWRGYFQIIANADQFVLYDDVQFDKNGWRNRNQINTPMGLQWITVPIKSKGRFGQLIREAEIDNDLPWKRKILGSIKTNYRKAKYFDKYFPWLEKSLDAKFLIDLDEKLTVEMCEFLGIQTLICRSTSCGLKAEDPVERLLELCAHFSANRYLSGPTAAAYLKPEAFAQNDIALEYQDYSSLPPYDQLFGPFKANVSALDALLLLDGEVNLGRKGGTSE